MRILVIDPGSFKAGFAIFREGSVCEHGIVPANELYLRALALVNEHRPSLIVVGNRTRKNEAMDQLKNLNLPIHLVDEHGSSEEARRLFFEIYPPKGIWRWLPKGFLFPDRDYDDIAAIVLGRRFLEGINDASKHQEKPL